MAAKKKLFTSFAALNLTQFFSAINDNLYKLLLVFLLINLLGPEHSNTILALAGGIFVLPFLLFASLAGTLADRFSKRSIIYFTRALEVMIMALGIIAFHRQSAIGGYGVLFLLATHSALFSPAKYGIVPEIVKRERISHYNGLLTATTYLAIIFGTFLAAFLVHVTHKNFVFSAFFCIAIALLGALASLGIEKTVPQSAKKKISLRFLSSIYYTLKRASFRRYLLPTILFGSYFLFMGAYTQLNIIPFTLQSLNLTPENGGYLFLTTAIGIGIGSFVAGQLSGDEVELGFVPFAAFVSALCFFALYFFANHLIPVIVVLFFLGVAGGFFIVPIEAFIQVGSPAQDRGQNVAAANFLSFIGVTIASLLIALLGNVFKLSASEGFLLISICTFILAICLFLVFLDQIFRLLVAKFFQFFGNIHVVGREKLLVELFDHPALIVAARRSWIDTLVVISLLPRRLRYIVPVHAKRQGQISLYRLLRFIPIDSTFLATHHPVQEIHHELGRGHPLVLMQPVAKMSDFETKWQDRLKGFEEKFLVPVISVEINRDSQGKTEQRSGKKKLFGSPIYVHIRALKK